MFDLVLHVKIRLVCFSLSQVNKHAMQANFHNNSFHARLISLSVEQFKNCIHSRWQRKRERERALKVPKQTRTNSNLQSNSYSWFIINCIFNTGTNQNTITNLNFEKQINSGKTNINFQNEMNGLNAGKKRGRIKQKRNRKHTTLKCAISNTQLNSFGNG